MTWTWPEQPAPAPIPMVGIRRRAVIAAASCSGHELQDDRERAGLLDGERVGEERPGGLLAGLALDADLAERVDRLGREADVAHDRDPGPDQRLDDPGAPDAALDLDGLRAGLAQEPPGVRERVLRAWRRRGTACRRRPAPAASPRTTAFVWWSISSIVTRTVVS